MLDVGKATKFIDQCWGDKVVPTLLEYIKIPNKSPSFDPEWAAHGYMDEAVSLFARWARAKLASLPGATLEVVRLLGRTPVIVIDVPGEGSDTVLLYGHLDKQPEMVGWTDGYGPWIPRLEGDKLYGRGGADDGYAMFGALSALLALREQGVPHARCVVLIEAREDIVAMARTVARSRLRGSVRRRPRLIWAKAAAFPSWPCSARNSRRRNLSSPVFSARIPNAHGPNEFLHIPTGKRVSVVIAQVLADHCAQSSSRR